jgi:hypothetical protein
MSGISPTGSNSSKYSVQNQSRSGESSRKRRDDGDSLRKEALLRDNIKSVKNQIVNIAKQTIQENRDKYK